MILIILINHRFVNLWIDICVDKFLIHGIFQKFSKCVISCRLIRNFVPSSSEFNTNEETYLTRHAKIARQSSNKIWIFCLPKRSKHSKHGGFKRWGLHKNLNAIHSRAVCYEMRNFTSFFFMKISLLSLAREQQGKMNR